MKGRVCSGPSGSACSGFLGPSVPGWGKEGALHALTAPFLQLPAPVPSPASSPWQRTSQAAAPSGLQKTQSSSCRSASPIGPCGGQDLTLAECLSPAQRTLTCHPWFFLAMLCGVWVRAAGLGPEPANHMSGHAHAQAGLLLQHPMAWFWEPAPALQEKDTGVTGVCPSECQVWYLDQCNGVARTGLTGGFSRLCPQLQAPGALPLPERRLGRCLLAYLAALSKTWS